MWKSSSASEQPGPRSDEAAVHGLADLAAGFAAVALLVVRAWSSAGARSAIVVGLTSVVTMVGVGRRGWSWWWAVAGAAICVLLAGPVVGVLALAAHVLVVWGMRGRPPVPSWPARAWAPEAARAFGSGVALVVSRLSFAVMAIALVIVPWSVGRLGRVDPLRPGQGWARRRQPSRASSPWARDAAPLPLKVRVRRNVSVVLVLLAIAATAVGVSKVRGSDAQPIPAAFAGDAWYPGYLADINWVWSTDVAFDPLSPLRVEDVHTRTVNVVDGKRSTWRPPTCGCRRLRVWVYGGSTTFGLGQRDDHTIPSELARAAWADGYALDVDNRGEPGDAHWEEAQRLGWDLANEPAPDLVVFYDGVNEMRSIPFVRSGPPRPVAFVKENFWAQYLKTTGQAGQAIAEGLVGRLPGTKPAGASVPSRPAARNLDADGWGRLVVDRYERSRWTSEALTTAAGVPSQYFWQPALDDRPNVRGEPREPGADFARRRSRAASASLSSDVVDLSHTFDGVDRPLFYDSNHTNEEGARLVADAMYRSLRSRIVAIAEG